jgi:hypothetical protein
MRGGYGPYVSRRLALHNRQCLAALPLLPCGRNTSTVKASAEMGLVLDW